MVVVIPLVVGAICFVMGAWLRRWYALLGPVALWGAFVLPPLFEGTLGTDGDWSAAGVLLLTAILIAAPGLLGAILGIAAGRALTRRSLERDSAVTPERRAPG